LNVGTKLSSSASIGRTGVASRERIQRRKALINDHVHIPFRAKLIKGLVKLITNFNGATAGRIRNEGRDELKTELQGTCSGTARTVSS